MALLPFSQPLAPPPGQPSAPAPKPVSWRDIIARVLEVKPNAPFAFIAEQVDKLAPMMSPQEQATWSQVKQRKVAQDIDAGKTARRPVQEAQRTSLVPPGARSELAVNPAAPPDPGGEFTPVDVGKIGEDIGNAADSATRMLGPVGTALRVGAKVLPGAVESVVTLPERAIRAAEQYQPGTGEIPEEAIATGVETALNVIGGAPGVRGGLGIGRSKPPKPGHNMPPEDGAVIPDDLVAKKAAPAGDYTRLGRKRPILPTDPEAVVLSRIAKPASSMPKSVAEAKELAAGGIDTMRKNFIDDLHLIKRVEEGLNNGKRLETIASPYDLMRLSRGAGGKAQHFNNHGTIDFNTLETTGPGLRDILAPVAKDLDRLRAFMMAKRAKELHERGVETGIDNAAIEATIARNETEIGPVLDGLKKYQDETLRYLKDAGILSDDAVKTMREANQSYVPFHRLVEETPSLRGGGKGFKVRNPVRRIKGSDLPIIDPLESIIKNTHLYVGLAERNRALRALRDMPGASDVMTRVKAPVHVTEVSEKEIARFLDDHDLPPELAEPMEIFRRGAQRPAPDEIAVWVDGKKEVYKTDPAIANAVNALDQPALDVVTRMLSGPAKLLRAGVVTTPAYMLRNITRDQINAAIQSRHGYRPVYDMMKGLGQIIGKKSGYTEWLKSGGSQSALIAMDRDYAGHDFLKLGHPNMSLAGRAKNIVTKPLQLMRAASETLDNATRVGEYMRATKGSTDPAAMMKGGLASRDVTQDFQRIGAKMRGINSVTAFMNAQIQGLSRELGNIKDRPLAALTKIAALITTPSIFLWAANHGDPRYEDAPNWEKDAFWFILPPDPKAEPLRVPKPFTLGTMFGSLPERMLSDFFGNKPDAYNEFLRDLNGGVMPNLIPTFAVPMIEQFGDRSLFTNRDLTSQRFDTEPYAEHATPYTSEAAKAIGAGVAKIPGMDDSSFASPIIIDNYIRGWTGTMGVGATKALDPLLRPSGAPKPPASTWADMPVIGAFISRYPSMSAQPIQDVFSLAERAAKGLTPDPNKTLDSAKRKLWVISKDARQVYDDPDMDPEQKRDTLRGLYTSAISEAKMALGKWRSERKPEARTKDDVATTQKDAELYDYTSGAKKLYKNADQKAPLWKEAEELGIKIDHRWSAATLAKKIADAKAKAEGRTYGGTQ